MVFIAVGNRVGTKEAIADGTVEAVTDTLLLAFTLGCLELGKLAFTLGCVELTTLGAFDRILLASTLGVAEAVADGTVEAVTDTLLLVFTLGCVELTTLGPFDGVLLYFTLGVAEAVVDGTSHGWTTDCCDTRLCRTCHARYI